MAGAEAPLGFRADLGIFDRLRTHPSADRLFCWSLRAPLRRPSAAPLLWLKPRPIATFPAAAALIVTRLNCSSWYFQWGRLLETKLNYSRQWRANYVISEFAVNWLW